MLGEGWALDFMRLSNWKWDQQRLNITFRFLRVSEDGRLATFKAHSWMDSKAVVVEDLPL